MAVVSVPSCALCSGVAASRSRSIRPRSPPMTCFGRRQAERLTSFAALRDRCWLPLIAAPMFRVSGVDLVVAACRNGVIGAFPTANCWTAEELDAWLGRITALLHDQDAAPWCANLIVHRSNPRMQDDLTVLLRHKAAMVITSVGSP